MKNLLLILPFLFSCTGVLYQPDSQIYSDPKKLNLDYEELKIQSSDNVSLNAWHFRTQGQKPKGLVLFFHGNAQNISSHYLSLAWLTRSGYELLIFDYRGYGKSNGVPNPKGVYEDGLAALSFARNLVAQKKLDHFIVYAQSLGGAIASRSIVDFKERTEIDLFVLDSTFSSFQEIAMDRMSTMWVTWPMQPLAYLLIDEEYAPKKHLKMIKMPTLVVHSKDDRVIPFRFGKEVFDLLETDKELWTLEGVGHIGTFHGASYQERKRFLKHIKKAR